MAVGTANAQSIQLSAEQQRMLNQLPPAQREQALSALRQMQGQASAQQGFSSLQEQPTPPPSQTVESMVPQFEDIEATAAPGSTLVVNFSLRGDLARDELARIDRSRALADLIGSHVFQLDATGALELPGVATVPVGGLTEDEIELRLGAEPGLRPFDITVSVIEVSQNGTASLKPFGYDVFESTNATFDPVTTGPVPPDYVLGPGDSVRVQLFGNVNGVYEYEVGRDGVLNLPELGPVTVAGLRFSDFRADLERRVSEMLIGTQVSATLGQLRTIRVFVFGDANRPGSYVVSSLATVSTAIYAAGGISEIGTLRDIQLKRSGDTVTRLDLYDMLLRGDTSDDVRLQPGDVIFIPPAGSRVSIAGAVRRPAIYETDGSTSVAEAIALAGGFAADAYPEGARIERIGSGAGRVVVSIDASSPDVRQMPSRDGDLVFVPDVLPEYQQTIEVFGHLYRAGPVEWRPGMRLTDVIPSIGELKPGADTGYVLIRRENPDDRRISVTSADLEAAWADRLSADNIEIRPRDRVYVFDLEYGRQRFIEPILDELQLQTRYNEPNPVVSVSGQVNAPGNYPLEPGMRVSDLIRAGGALTEEAYASKAELVRYEVGEDGYRSTEIVDVDLAAVLSGNEAADLTLSEHDNLRISTLPDWDTLWTVTLEGEVTFPGQYRIRKGETLSQLLERAGGLTDAAFAEGAVFLRESLRQQEQQQIEILARRLEADLTSQTLESTESGSTTIQTGRSLLSQLRETEAVGRLVIDLASIAANRGVDKSIELRDQDRLLIPKQAQSVTVIGETQQNTSHLFDPALSRDDYIEKSGGLTRRADRKLIYVVRASGAVQAQARSKWFGRSGTDRTGIRPGDTIVVPIEIDRVRPITLWTQITQILYQAAIAVAAVDTFNRR